MELGARLRAARHLAGLRQKDLAEHCEVTVAAISKFEKDLCRPSLEVLIKLADAVGTTVDFLVRPSTTPVPEFCHREFSDLGVRKREALETHARVALERRLVLEQIVFGDGPPTYTGPRAIRVHTLEGAEGAACQVREHLGLGLRPIPDLARLLEDHHVRIAVTPPGFERSDGLCAWAGGEIPFIMVTAANSGDRQRFTLAHELGHLLCAFDEALDEEAAGHRFAGALLVPRDPILSLGGRQATIGLSHLLPLKQEYGISLQALMFRCRDCGIISNGSYTALCREIGRHGWRSQEPCPVPVETPTAMDALLEQALSLGRISEARAAELSGVSLRDFLSARRSEAGALVPSA